MGLSKEERAEKLIKWMEMDEEERRKWNGHNGFLKGELFKDSNLFMTEDKAKLKKRIAKEKVFRENKKLKLNKQMEQNGK